MKEFFGGSSPKDIFQAKLNSMMEKSNSDNPMGMKRNTQKNLQLREEMKNTICKRKPKKKKERKKYIMGYEYALLEKRRNRHTNCSPGRDHCADYRWAHGTERSSDDPAALLPTTWCFSFRKQAFPLSAVS